MSKRRSGLSNHRRAFVYNHGCENPPPPDVVVTITNTYFITAGNTVWLYPPEIVSPFVFDNPSITVSSNGFDLYFMDKDAIRLFYDDINNACNAAQPVGNAGFSLGVGTILLDLGFEVNLIPVDGEPVVRWRIVQQISDQTSISVGGNSPNGTIGFVCIYETWTQEDFALSSGLDNTSISYIVPYTGALPP